MKILRILAILGICGGAELQQSLLGHVGTVNYDLCQREFRQREDVLVVEASNFQLHLGWIKLEGCDPPGAGGQSGWTGKPSGGDVALVAVESGLPTWR